MVSSSFKLGFLQFEITEPAGVSLYNQPFLIQIEDQVSLAKNNTNESKVCTIGIPL